MNRRQQIIKRQQEITALAQSENRDLNEAERSEFDNLQRELEALDAPGAEGTGINGAAEGAERGLSANPPNTAEEVARALAAERTRSREIRSMCRTFGMDAEADGYVDGGQTVEEVRALVMEKLAKDHAPVGARVLADETDKFRAAAADGLALRAGVNIEKPADGARDFRNMSLRDLAVECKSREGEDIRSLIRMNGDDLYANICREFYNPTAAFPAILDATIKKSIVNIYNAVPTTFQNWTTKGSLSDFKESKDHEYVMGGLGDFQKVSENGEIKADKPSTELLPSRKLETYGKQFSMTRQAFINDDIDFVSKVPGLYATKSKQTIDKQVYTILFNNGKIFDGKTLFGTDHKNVMGTAAKPSQASLQAMILQMQKQTDQFGDAIYVNPRYIIVPVGYQFDLSVILHSAQVPGSNNNDYNPMLNYPLEIIQTPVLNALAGTNAAPWFMVADQMSARSLQVDYLNGQETPIVRRMEAPGVLGYTWDIYTDWGIAVRDFRGIAKNTGVKMD